VTGSLAARPGIVEVTFESPQRYGLGHAVTAWTPHGRLPATPLVAQVITLYTTPRQFLAAPAAYRPFAGRLTIDAGGDALALLARAELLRALRATVRFMAAEADVGAVLVLASLGIPVLIAPSPGDRAIPPSAVARYFARSPVLDTPIEPFYSLLRRRGPQRVSAPTLPELYREVPGRHLYVDARGRVSLSPRLAHAGVFFGRAADEPARWRRSPAWRRVIARPDWLFATLQPCACCRAWDGCRGFWRVLDGAEQSCAAWCAIMDELPAAPPASTSLQS
jgi:hypothetical protein